ncbi:hypothetical protein [Enterovirga rhinocerotis]|uniref:hypothetical protein n=1 Tax=Enterovirga rhinocerotis TaxID=1339210 RepID=UPI00105B933A|nr:hypothetical protein [Enterovirga rhinocerotis]
MTDLFDWKPPRDETEPRTAVISREELQQQVLAQIVAVMARSGETGLSAIQTARERFPGTPNGVLMRAYSIWSTNREEAWWRALEDGVNAPTVRRALEGPKP